MVQHAQTVKVIFLPNGAVRKDFFFAVVDQVEGSMGVEGDEKMELRPARLAHLFTRQLEDVPVAHAPRTCVSQTTGKVLFEAEFVEAHPGIVGPSVEEAAAIAMKGDGMEAMFFHEVRKIVDIRQAGDFITDDPRTGRSAGQNRVVHVRASHVVVGLDAKNTAQSSQTIEVGGDFVAVDFQVENVPSNALELDHGDMTG